MARVRPNLDEVMQKDALEERQAIAEVNKQKKIKKRRRRRYIVLWVCVLLFGVYIFSDYSNIRVIDIKGNEFYTKAQLLKKANISYSMKSVLAPSFLIENRIEKDPLIKDTTISKTWDGVVRIQIEEVNMVGYYNEKGKSYLVVKGEDDVYIKDEALLAHVPYINDLSAKQRAAYKKNVDLVKKKNVWMISEVSTHKTSYNDNMLKLVMQDGHIVYTTMEGLRLLDYYLEMLKALNTTHKCITFVEETNSSYSEKCE